MQVAVNVIAELLEEVTGSQRGGGNLQRVNRLPWEVLAPWKNLGQSI